MQDAQGRVEKEKGERMTYSVGSKGAEAGIHWKTPDLLNCSYTEKNESECLIYKGPLPQIPWAISSLI